MITIAIASTNPIKIRAFVDAFARMFPDESEFQHRSLTVESGVRAQPLSDKETRQGALNRIERIYELCPEADYWCAVEGGVENDPITGMQAFAWVAIFSKDIFGMSRTASFTLPMPVADLIKQGLELGEADDQVFGRTNSKQQNGAVGLLTEDKITRAMFYEHAAIMALIPFKNPQFTF